MSPAKPVDFPARRAILGASNRRRAVGGMPFIEMHGPDNDFVVLDDGTRPIA